MRAHPPQTIGAAPVTTPARFDPSRLRLGRELQGWSQAQLAQRCRLTPAAVSQFESGQTRPSTETEALLANELQVPTAFLAETVVETHEGFFRSLRKSSVTQRRRARALAHIAHDVATAGHFPRASVPRHPVGLDADTAEADRAAAAVRKDWGVPPGPVGNVVQLLEEHGVTVIRLPLDTADVDAFSLPFEDHPVVVLGSDKNDRARSRFDAAHELGHLVMHGDQVWGLKEIEDQAHAFAAAFLLPEADVRHELPERADWPTLFRLKLKWQVSLAALLYRAKTLGRMSPANYLSAVKASSARGWRRSEPVPLGAPEAPTKLAGFLRHPSADEATKHLPKEILCDLVASS